MAIPESGSQWNNKKSGKKYTVLCVTNIRADRDRWPITVVYQDAESRIWSRPLSEWAERYEEISLELEITMSDEFYAVWRKTGGGPPQKRHDTREEAIKEAKRLSSQAGEEYYVLQVIGIVRPTYPPVEYIDFTEVNNGQ